VGGSCSRVFMKERAARPMYLLGGGSGWASGVWPRGTAAGRECSWASLKKKLGPASKLSNTFYHANGSKSARG
jgi:hypothetical protein